MITYIAPRTDVARITFLTKAVNAYDKDKEKGYNYVGEDIILQINEFLPKYQDEHNKISSLQGSRVKDVEERKTAIYELENCCKDFCEVLKRRVIRNKLSVSVLVEYGIQKDGKVVFPRKMNEWIEFSESLIKREAGAVAKGYEPMQNPSVADIQTFLDIAKKESKDVADTDRSLDAGEESLALLREKADSFIQEVMDYLRFNLRKKDSPSQRRIMRTYGAVFTHVNDNGVIEPTEE